MLLQKKTTSISEKINPMKKTIILEIKSEINSPQNSGNFPQFLEQFGESLSYLSSVNDFYQNEIEKDISRNFNG